MKVNTPKFTFTDLQLRHDLKTGRKNKKAMIIADELDRTGTKYSPRYQPPHQTTAQEVNQQMKFSRLL